MKKLILNPNVSVGPFVFGTKREDMWAIMKKEFGSERDLPVFETEDYENPHVQLEYIDEKLISVTFIDDIRKRYCEIYLGNEKIWPRTEKKFLSIFGRDSFVETFGAFYHTELSLLIDCDHNPPSLTIGCDGYCNEIVENFRLFYTASKMKKGMSRDECRMLINRQPLISDDGRTDCYPYGKLRPEVTSLTYDSNNKLIKATQSYPEGKVLNITLN
jgi:hypothetical protein